MLGHRVVIENIFVYWVPMAPYAWHDRLVRLVWASDLGLAFQGSLYLRPRLVWWYTRTLYKDRVQLRRPCMPSLYTVLVQSLGWRQREPGKWQLQCDWLKKVCNKIEPSADIHNGTISLCTVIYINQSFDFVTDFFLTRSRLLAEWVHCQHSKKAWLNFLDILKVVTLWPKGLRPFGIPGRSAGGRPCGQKISEIWRGSMEQYISNWGPGGGCHGLQYTIQFNDNPLAKHRLLWALNLQKYL